MRGANFITDKANRVTFLPQIRSLNHATLPLADPLDEQSHRPCCNPLRVRPA
ncbi:hypothetical protein QVN06_25280 (plasmid) [Escherichia coli]|uniref:hypothetical protein n=1 Tax=Escherichia coli TaxID=562 RepID=UPI0025B265D1|nr:hypothetical protein [Escherichia coli]WJV92359.1 hypothetical protein QVN06_25280 [Escherichia coli]